MYKDKKNYYAELQGVEEEIKIALNQLEESKQIGGQNEIDKVTSNSECSDAEHKIEETIMDSGIEVIEKKQTTEKCKVEEGHDEGEMTKCEHMGGATYTQHTVSDSGTSKDMGNLCEGRLRRLYALKKMRGRKHERRRKVCRRKLVKRAAGTQDERQRSQADRIDMLMYFITVCVFLLLNLVKVVTPGSVDHDIHAG